MDEEKKSFRRDGRQYTWDPIRKLWKRKIRKPDGGYLPVYGHTPEELDANVEARAAALAIDQAHRNDPTVAEACASWFATLPSTLSNSRRQDYRNAINNHICPVIGPKRISDLTEDDVASVMRPLEGRSESLNQKVLLTLKRVCKYAVKHKWLSESPAEDRKPTGKPADERDPLNEKERTELLEAVRGTRAETFVMLGLYTGMRREEILGLKWKNVDLSESAPCVKVRETVEFINNNQPAVREMTKSKAGRRDIPIPPQLVEHLAALPPMGAEAHIVHDGAGGPLSYSQYRNLWKIVDRRTASSERPVGTQSTNHDMTVTISRHITPHIMRHTYITDLFRRFRGMEPGAMLEKVRYLAGHSTLQQTINVYVHWAQNTPDALIDDIRAAFAPEELPEEAPEPAPAAAEDLPDWALNLARALAENPALISQALAGTLGPNVAPK